MNYKALCIFMIIFAMVLGPAAAGILADGQAGESMSADGNVSSENAPMLMELYVVSTGERVELSVEEYVTGVVLAEVPCSYGNEVLKAAAVAVRSFCIRRLETGEINAEHFAADVCTDWSHCMGYVSLAEAVSRWGADRADAYYKMVESAVSETAGEVLAYGGEIADAVFHISSEGVTESAESVWGIEIPYLTSVKTGETAEKESLMFTVDEAESILERAGIVYGRQYFPEELFGERKVNGQGRTAYVTVGGTSVSGNRIKEIFGLASARFEVKYSDGVYCFTAWGRGHGVGMSLEGAEIMANGGKNYSEILAHYYPGTGLEVYQISFG